MRWPPWSSNSNKERDDKAYVSWQNSLNGTDWAHYQDPRTVGVVLAAAIAGSITTIIAGKVYRSSIRRIPEAGYIKPTIFRKKSLFGTVTRVGDGDNFHLFHQPGGRLTGWGWLPGRRIPVKKTDLRGQTIAIRIAGIDAPEGAHFGKPAQPYAAEALKWLTDYVLDRRVRAYIYRRDQYDRMVATVWVRHRFFSKDVGKEMLRVGLATVYEGTKGAEFGASEKKYREVEAWAKARKRGMWAVKAEDYESPREYKIRTAHMNELKHEDKEEKKTTSHWRRFFGGR